ncbi:hypothetical protein EPO15_00510, partial [bacterium]
GPEGTLYAVGGTSVPANYLVVTYSQNLLQLSSATWNGAANATDFAQDAAVLSSSQVFVVGQSFNGSDYDAVMVRLDLTPAPVVEGLSASGYFDGPYGSVLSGSGGTNDDNFTIHADTVTAGGPFFYVVAQSTTGNVGAFPDAAAIVKYDAAGVFVSSVSLLTGPAGHGFAMDSSHNIYVHEGDDAGTRLSKFDKDLRPLASIAIGSDIGGFQRIATDGTNIYVTAASGTTNGYTKVVKYGPDLVALATAPYSVPDGRFASITYDDSAVYVMYSTGNGSATTRRLVTFAPGLGSILNDVNVTTVLNGQFNRMVRAAGGLFVASANGTLGELYLRKFDASGNYTGVSSTFSGVVGGTGQHMTLGPDGTLYVMGGSSVGAVLDALVLRYDQSLTLLSSATHNGAANGADFFRDAVVLTSSRVVVTGRSYNGTDFDGVSGYMNLSSGTAVPTGAFSGNFSTPGGAVYTGGYGNDQANRVVLDTVTVGGPYAYLLATTSSTLFGGGGATGGQWLIVKYGPTGVVLASATYSNQANLWDGALDEARNLYVIGQTGTSSVVAKYDSSLRMVASQPIVGSGYALAVNPAGTHVYTLTFAENGQNLTLDDRDASLAVVQTTDVRAYTTAFWGESVRAVLSESGSDLYLHSGFFDGDSQTGPPNFTTYRYATAGLSLVSSAAYTAGASNFSTDIALDPAGNVYVAGVSTTGASGEAIIVKYSPTLVQIATRTMSAAVERDGARSVVVDASGEVYFSGRLPADPYAFTARLSNALADLFLFGGVGSKAMSVVDSSRVYVSYTGAVIRTEVLNLAVAAAPPPAPNWGKPITSAAFPSPSGRQGIWFLPAPNDDTYVVWTRDNGGADFDVLAQRIAKADGANVWGSTLTLVAGIVPGSNGLGESNAVSDGAGGLVFGYQDSTQACLVSRFGPSGSKLWGPVAYAATADGCDGGYLAVEGGFGFGGHSLPNSTIDYRHYIQAVNVANGALVGGAVNDFIRPLSANGWTGHIPSPAGGGQANAGTVDFQFLNGGTTLSAARVDSAQQVNWSTTFSTVTGQFTDQGFGMTGDGASGAFIVWEDSGTKQLNALHVTAAGSLAPGWPQTLSSNLYINTEHGGQGNGYGAFDTLLTSSGPVVAWAETSGENAVIRAALMGPGGATVWNNAFDTLTPGGGPGCLHLDHRNLVLSSGPASVAIAYQYDSCATNKALNVVVLTPGGQALHPVTTPFAGLPSNVSQHGAYASPAGNDYTVGVSISSHVYAAGIPGAGAGSPPAAPITLSFTGSFGQPGGAVVASQNGQHEYSRGIAVDTVTVGGPYVYVIVASTDSPDLTDPDLQYLVKYGPTGVKLASAALAGNDGGNVVLDAARNVYVGETLETAFWSGGPSWISKFDKDLVFLSSAALPAAVISTLGDMVSDGTYLYANTIADGFGATLLKLDASLALLASYDYPNANLNRGSGVALDAAGNVYSVVGSSSPGHRFLKLDANLTPVFDRDVSSLFPGSEDVFIAFSGANLYGVMMDTAGVHVHVRRFDSGLNYLASSTFTAAGSGMSNRAKIATGADGDLYVLGMSSHVGVLRYDTALNLLSTAAFAPGAAAGSALAATDLGDIFVAGAAFNGTDFDAVVRRLDLRSGGGPAPVQLVFYPGRVDSTDNRNEALFSFVADTAAAGGPFLYAVATSTTGPTGSSPGDYFVLKFSSLGVVVASAPLSGSHSGDGLALGNGAIYVGEKQPGSFLAVDKLDLNLVPVGGTSLSFSDCGNITRLVAGGGFVYAACDGGQVENHAKLIKFDANMNELARATYTANPGYMLANSIARNVPGQLFVSISTGEGTTQQRLVKYDANLNLLADVDLSAWAYGNAQVAYSSGAVYAVSRNNGGPTTFFVRKFLAADLAYAGFASTIVAPGPSPYALIAANNWGVAVGLSSGTADGGDYFVQRYDFDLAPVSSGVFDGGFGTRDGATGLALYGSSDVFVGGFSLNGLHDDGIVLRQSIPGFQGGGAAPAGPTPPAVLTYSGTLPGGLNVDSVDHRNESFMGMVADPATGNLYAVATSTTGPWFSTTDWDSYLLKISPQGVVLSSVPLPAQTVAYTLAFEGGALQVGVSRGEPTIDTGVHLYDANLVFQASVTLTAPYGGTQVVGRGGYVYALDDGGGALLGGVYPALVVKYTPSLTEVARTTYALPGALETHGRSMAVDAVGNLYVAASSRGYTPMGLVKFDANLQPVASADISYLGDPMGLRLAYGGGKVYVFGKGVGEAYVRRFASADLAYDGVAATITVTGASAWGGGVVVDSGNLVTVGLTSSTADGGDFLVRRFDANLVAVSSGLFDAGFNGADSLTVLLTTGTEGVYLAGVGYNGAHDDGVLMLRSVGAAAAPAGVPGCAVTKNVKKDGSLDATTIQGGVDLLGASLSGDSCVVVRDTGTYAEQVTVQGVANNGFRISIMADPSFVGALPVVDPPLASTAAFRVMNAGVSLSNLKVLPTNAVSYGVLVSSDDVAVSSLTVEDAGGLLGTGVYLDAGVSGLTLDASTITTSHATSPSVYFYQASSNVVTRSYLYNASGPALYIEGSTGNVISFSTMTGHNAVAEGAVFFSGAPSYTTVTNCVISNPAGASFHDTGSHNVVAASLLGSVMLESADGLMTGDVIAGELFVNKLAANNTVSFSTVAGVLIGGSTTTLLSSYITGNPPLHLNGSTGTVVSGSTLVASAAGYDAIILNSAGNLNLSVSGSRLVGGSASAGLRVNAGAGLLSFVSNQVEGGALGIQFSAQAGAAELAFADVKFQSLAPGATAVQFLGGVVVSTFSGFRFADTNVAVNVDGGALSAGSRVTMLDALGPRSGAAFETDPGDLVDWTASPGGLVHFEAASLVGPTVGTNENGTAFLRLDLWSEGGNAKLTGLRVALAGDAPPQQVLAKVYNDANADGVYQPGSDFPIGAAVFTAGLPPTASLTFATRTVTASTSTLFIGLDLIGVPPGRSVGAELSDPSAFVFSNGDLSPDAGPFPAQSDLAITQFGLAANPAHMGYPTPVATPSPSGGFETGLFINPGQTVLIAGAGTWDTGAFGTSGPAGLASSGGVAGLPLGSLMARIGASPWFFVGTGTTFVAAQSGPLALAMNDSDYTDNSLALSVSFSIVPSTQTRTWLGTSGYGQGADIPQNWQGGQVPQAGESVSFNGSVSNADCDWNLYQASVGKWTMSQNYTGTVRLRGAAGPDDFNQVQVSSNAILGGGTLELGRHKSFSVQGHLVVRGVLDLGQDDTHVSVGDAVGLRVHAGGLLRWTGAGFAGIHAGGFAPSGFTVDDGTVDVRGPGLLLVDNSSAVVLTANANILAFDGVEFGGFMPDRAAALVLQRSTAAVYAFNGLRFDGAFAVNVDGSGLPAGASFTMAGSAGPMRGTPHELDPNGAVNWAPDGGGSASLAGTVFHGSVNAPAGSTVFVRASTQPFFDPMVPDPGPIAPLGGWNGISGGYSFPTLDAPATYYLVAWLESDGDGLPSGVESRGAFGRPGLFRSAPLFVAPNDSLTGKDITFDDWGEAQGSVVNASQQFGPVLVAAAQAVSTSTLESVSFPQDPGPFALAGPSLDLLLVAWVDVNNNRERDSFEAFGTTQVIRLPDSAGYPGSLLITITGGSAAQGGTVSVASSVVHPGAVGDFGAQPMVLLALTASGSQAELSGI